MRSKTFIAAAVAVLAVPSINSALADGSAQRGAMVYGACAACHSLEPDVQLTGPSLAGMWGRRAASVADYPRYSPALKDKDFAWDEVTLYAWLADPKAFVPGTYMTFRGLRDVKQRNDLIAFLKIAAGPDGAKAVVAQKLIPPDEARGQVPEPLRDVKDNERIASIRHCKSTFFVRTADGNERAIWELNLRIKVDSGASGPPAGQPVLLPAGMQGDRASAVFSAVSEIARTVEEKCPSDDGPKR